MMEKWSRDLHNPKRLKMSFTRPSMESLDGT